MEVWLGAENPARTVHKNRIDHLFSCSPLPQTFLLIWGESYKYWILRKDSSVFSVVVEQFCDGTVVLTSSSTSLWSSHLFNIPRQRASLLFFGLSLCWFLSRFLGCLWSFSDYHLSVFGHCKRGLPSLPSYNENLLIWVDSMWVVPPLSCM
jgi:hypothetical protein